MVINITAKELADLIKAQADKIEIIDLRSQEEFNNSHIVNSRLVPFEDLQKRIDEIDWGKDVIFICRSGNTSAYAANSIDSDDRNIRNIKGGILGVQAEGLADILEVS